MYTINKFPIHYHNKWNLPRCLRISTFRLSLTNIMLLHKAITHTRAHNFFIFFPTNLKCNFNSTQWPNNHASLKQPSWKCHWVIYCSGNCQISNSILSMAQANANSCCTRLITPEIYANILQICANRRATHIEKYVCIYTDVYRYVAWAAVLRFHVHYKIMQISAH